MGRLEPGSPSPWQALLKRLKTEGLHITQLQLQRAGRTVVSKAKADGYVACYEVRMALFNGGQRHHQGIGFVDISQNVVFLNWMDNNGQIWQDQRPLRGEGGMFIHSTLA